MRRYEEFGPIRLSLKGLPPEQLSIWDIVSNSDVSYVSRIVNLQLDLRDKIYYLFWRVALHFSGHLP
jgi:hypothetical protein